MANVVFVRPWKRYPTGKLMTIPDDRPGWAKVLLRRGVIADVAAREPERPAEPPKRQRPLQAHVRGKGNR